MSDEITRDEDWIKTLSWDLGTDLWSVVVTVCASADDDDEARALLERFLKTMPAAEAMPADLKQQAWAFIDGGPLPPPKLQAAPVKVLLDRRTGEVKYEGQPRDEHGRFGEGTLGPSDASNSAPLSASFRDGALEEGKAVTSLLYGNGKTDDQCKAAVAHDLAARMNSDTKSLLSAAVGPDTARVALDAMQSGGMFFSPNNDGSWPLSYSKDEVDLNRSVFDNFPNGVLVAANSPEGEAFIREAATSFLVSQWAATSNDSDARALALQDVAMQTFGIEHAEAWTGRFYDDREQLASETRSYVEQNGAVYRDFLTSQYQATQEMFAEKGIESVNLWRGERATEPFGQDTRDSSTFRPLSSWTTTEDTARHFAESGTGGYVFSANVPVSRILSTPLTGLGCRSESEFVVIAGTGEAQAEDV